MGTSHGYENEVHGLRRQTGKKIIERTAHMRCPTILQIGQLPGRRARKRLFTEVVALCRLLLDVMAPKENCAPNCGANLARSNSNCCHGCGGGEVCKWANCSKFLPESGYCRHHLAATREAEKEERKKRENAKRREADQGKRREDEERKQKLDSSSTPHGTEVLVDVPGLEPRLYPDGHAIRNNTYTSDKPVTKQQRSHKPSKKNNNSARAKLSAVVYGYKSWVRK